MLFFRLIFFWRYSIPVLFIFWHIDIDPTHGDVLTNNVLYIFRDRNPTHIRL
jgi:hypothetical protein